MVVPAEILNLENRLKHVQNTETAVQLYETTQ